MKRELLLVLLAAFALAGCGDSKPPAVAGAAATPPSVPADPPESKPPPADTNSPSASNVKPPPDLERLELVDEPPAAEAQIAAWIAALSSESAAAREEAEQALQTAGGSATLPLLAALKSRSPGTRQAVAYFLLEKFSVRDERLSAGLREALSDEDRRVRHLALQAVKRMPPEAIAAAVPQIVGLLDPDREEPANRADAARLLGRLGSEGRGGLAALEAAARQDPSEKVRAPALHAVSRTADPARAVAVLAAALASDREASVRLVAATGLGRLGRAAAVAAPELAAALEDQDEKVRRAASDALAELEGAAVEALVPKLASPNPRARELALFTLGRLGPAAKSAAPAIARLKQDEDPAVRRLAEAVLATLEAL